MICVKWSISSVLARSQRHFVFGSPLLRSQPCDKPPWAKSFEGSQRQRFWPPTRTPWRAYCWCSCGAFRTAAAPPPTRSEIGSNNTTHHENRCSLTHDLEHALNHVDRSELRRVAPGLATWCDTRFADPSSVMFGNVKIMSLRGVQEGDRLGRLLFVSGHRWFLLPR